MNKEQVKSAIRTLVATFGGLLAGFFAAKGWLTSDQVMSVLTSEAFLSISASVAVGVWGVVNKTRKNSIAVVDEMAKDPTSAVKGVILEPTAAGRELAASIPGSTAVVAGTHEATAIATR